MRGVQRAKQGGNDVDVRKLGDPKLQTRKPQVTVGQGFLETFILPTEEEVDERRGSR